MHYLEIIDGQGRRRQVALNKPRLVIGRESNCEIHLPHPSVARRQAQLLQNEAGNWVLQDLSGRAHIFVQNQPVAHLVLEPRKLFRIAEYSLALIETNDAISEVEQWGPVPNESEDSSLLERVQLEHLQIFQRSLRFLDEPRKVLESVAREFERAVQPRGLAIGVFQGNDYLWEVVHSEEEGGRFRQELDQAEQQRDRQHGISQSWMALPSAGGKIAKAEEAKSLLIPLKGRRESLGHIIVSHPRIAPVPLPLRRFLSLVASYAGLAWENLQLTQFKQHQIKLEQELAHARQIQIGLFPDTLAIDPRLDAFAVNLPSAKVSGDYYDLIRTGPNTVAFVIADAMGHGMPAALMMAAVRAALRMGLNLKLPWPTLFQGIDDLIRQAQADSFVTGLVGEVNLASQELTIVSAGHPAPSVVVDGQPRETPAECLTRPWGLDVESPWGVGKISLKGNRWSILCCTDGVTDRSRARKESHAIVSQFHRRVFENPAEDICQGLLTEVADSAAADDQTVLVLCSAG